MATANPTLPASPVASLQQVHVKSESLLRSSLRRLLRNRFAVGGMFILSVFVLLAVFAPVIAPRDFAQQSLGEANSAPLWMLSLFPTMKARDEGGYVKINDSYPLGADKLGRDLLSRIIYGARVSLLVAFIGPVVALLIGVSLGLIAGYWGGRIDNIIMRFTDIMYAFPTLLLIILFMAFFRPTTGLEPGTIAFQLNQLDRSMGGMLFIFIGIGLTSWMQMARLTRGQVLAVRNQEYITAANALGAPNGQIMRRHVLPNILGPIIVSETLTIPRYISYEAFLSFIGLGVNPPTPSWGAMIAEGAGAIRDYPNQAIFPALALFLVMFAFNFLGDGLRDALDPRMRGAD
ncbi:MAG: ABC transporter permease [Anaerolineae bacterium]|nr:ABC transporter permease [Anaerolineae bacterium]